MSFFKKIFKSYKKEPIKEQVKQEPVSLAIDDTFVHNFINKGGKFLYCSEIKEVVNHLESIFLENNWKQIICTDNDLLKLTRELDINTQTKFNSTTPFFTTCEHLIASEGSILFSSNQLGSNKLFEFSEHFIVYATTSQLVRNVGEGLTGIKINFKGNIPTNISSIKNYSLKNTDENFLNYGNTNSKNLYLLLFEDL